MGPCANCKWPDLASQCSVQGELWQEIGRQQVDGPRTTVHRAVLPQGSAAENPINLEPELGDSGNPIDVDGDGSEHNPIEL